MSQESEIKFVTADVSFPETLQKMRAAVSTALGMAGRDVVGGKAHRVFDTQNANPVVQKAESKKEAQYAEHMVGTYYWLMGKCDDGMTMAIRANPGYNAMEQAENPFLLMEMISAAVYSPSGDPFATKRLARIRLMDMVQLPDESIMSYILRVDRGFKFMVLLEESHSVSWEEFAPELQDDMFNLVRLGVDKKRNEEFVLLAAGRKPKTFSVIKDFVNEMASLEKPAAVASSRPAAAAVAETPLLDADAVVHLVHAEMAKKNLADDKSDETKKHRGEGVTSTRGGRRQYKGQLVCFRYNTDDGCSFGNRCKFNHTISRDPAFEDDKKAWLENNPS
jgi:hypothetical protein